MSYLALVTPTPDGYAGLVAELTVLATAQTLEGITEALSQGLALHLLDAETPLPKPRARRLDDLPLTLQAAYRGQDVQELLVTPASLNPVSLKVERAIAASGLSYREIARRLQTTQTAVLQLADPFYGDHTVSALRQLAAVLHLALDVAFVVAVDLPGDALPGRLWGGLSTPKLRVRDVPEVLKADLPLTVRTAVGTFQLIRETKAGTPPDGGGSTVYEAWQLD